MQKSNKEPNKNINGILIIDDDEYKVEKIKSGLEKIYPTSEIFIKKTRNSSLYFLITAESKIDLVILDWNFPLLDGLMPEMGMGEEVLVEIKRKKIDKPVIVCSSDKVWSSKQEYEEARTNYPNLIGQINYSPLVPIENSIIQILSEHDLLSNIEIDKNNKVKRKTINYS